MLFELIFMFVSILHVHQVLWPCCATYTQDDDDFPDPSASKGADAFADPSADYAFADPSADSAAHESPHTGPAAPVTCFCLCLPSS